ncbi:bacteriohemerythrin [uncultured Desulfuromusa sp.]|uniref:bacteriohemerythrin n=1 Tax=uncultured Desulfuromusa sp. TaxID=219183 RepID=UPI002AA8D2CD|nr:bacteriohemerythrin [uncultured Desulfuromusa sp.]
MAIITWKKIYETGIVALDNEHQGLISQINKLYEAIRDKHEEEGLEATLTMLESYTVNHFQHEEKLMAEYHYPGLADHQKSHQELIDAVQDLKQRASSGKDELARELLKLLRVWVLEHILDVDKKYGAFLESRGGRFIS